MERIQKKKFLIISIYSVIFILAGLAVYSFLAPKKTCFDSIKNQNEEDIDCGGICARECEITQAQEIIIEKAGTVPSGINGKFDFYAQLINPNAFFGSRKFNFIAKFKDAFGNEITKSSGSGFILPGERKYVTLNNIDSTQDIASAEIEITDSEWVGFNDDYENPNIKVVNKNYEEISNGVGFSEARGLLKNDSPYDFNAVNIKVILKDESGTVIALNSTLMKTVESGEERDFLVAWPNHFPGTVANMQIQPEVNIFDLDNFLKRYYKSERFQQY